MAPTEDAVEVATAALSVHNVAAMGDAQLAQFMKNHRLLDGGYDLPIDGWDKLSRGGRTRLAERLKALERTLAQSPTGCSHPLDLDDLDGRLRQIPPDTNASLRAGSHTIARSERSRSPFDPEADRRKWEVLPYQDLVSDGGRPVYPIDLLEDVLNNPNRFEDILRPWQESLNGISPDGVFLRQLQRWQDFRKWQNDNRGLEDDDGGFPAYVERQKKYIREEVLEEPGAKELSEIEANPLCLKPSWDQDQRLRRRQRRLFREHGCDGFNEYAAAVKRRLARHHFTRPFELDEDPKKQDKLHTWIEYLNFEYWWLDKYVSDIERLQPDHDRVWQELVDLKILRPHETMEYIRTFASPMERQADEDKAREDVRRIEAEAREVYRLTQEDPDRLEIPKARRISMMKEGTAKLLAAKEQLKCVLQRNEQISTYIRSTFDHTDAQRFSARHRVLVQWVLDQVPLVEAETAQANVKEAKAAKSMAKRRLSINDEEPSRTPARSGKLIMSRIGAQPQDQRPLHSPKRRNRTPTGCRTKTRPKVHEPSELLLSNHIHPSPLGQCLKARDAAHALRRMRLLRDQRRPHHHDPKAPNSQGAVLLLMARNNRPRPSEESRARAEQVSRILQLHRRGEGESVAAESLGPEIDNIKSSSRSDPPTWMLLDGSPYAPFNAAAGNAGAVSSEPGWASAVQAPQPGPGQQRHVQRN